MSASWNITASQSSINTVNPIRNIVDKIQRPQNHPQPIIDLALGDPSVFGNLPPHTIATDAVCASVKNDKTHGYTNSMGSPLAREAIAKYMTTNEVSYEPKDIVVTCGGSQAILLPIQLLANPGESILIPKPGFALYETVCGHLGVNAVFYNLNSDKSWEIDLEDVQNRIDECNAAGKPVKAIIMNNPGNPTGSNYSREHLVDVQAVCARNHLPMITDEIYANMVFKGQTFTPFAAVAGDVPTFTICGLAKQFLVPGWRVGWLAIQDKKNYLSAALPHLVSLTQVVLGATTIVQNALPELFSTLTPEYYSNLNNVLDNQATVVFNACKDIDGLTCITPQGAMYVMVKIDFTKFKGISNDQEFCQLLLSEENVMLLPGACFKAEGFFRIVFCAPEANLLDFASRLQNFCARHRA